MGKNAFFNYSHKRVCLAICQTSVACPAFLDRFFPIGEVLTGDNETESTSGSSDSESIVLNNNGKQKDLIASFKQIKSYR